MFFLCFFFRFLFRNKYLSLLVSLDDVFFFSDVTNGCVKDWTDVFSDSNDARNCAKDLLRFFLHSVPTKYTALGGGSVLQFSQVVCLLFRCGALAWQSLSISLAAEREMAK